MITYLINYFTIVFIIGLSGRMFPKCVSYNSPKTVFITVALMSLVEVCICILYLISSMNLLKGKLSSLVSIGVLIILSFVSIPLSLFLADKWIAGFEMNGFLTYLILTILIQIFTINSKE